MNTVVVIFQNCSLHNSLENISNNTSTSGGAISSGTSVEDGGSIALVSTTILGNEGGGIANFAGGNLLLANTVVANTVVANSQGGNDFTGETPVAVGTNFLADASLDAAIPGGVAVDPVS